MKLSRIREPQVVRYPCVQVDVLQGDGNPGERPALSLLYLLVRPGRLREGRLPHQGDVGADVLFHGVDPLEDRGGDLGGGRLTRPELILQFVNG